jgi:hypothetical protein
MKWGLKRSAHRRSRPPSAFGERLRSPPRSLSPEARMIIQLARAGEGDPERLCAGGLDVLRD